MKDIANDLGVSLMTISKALRGHRDISDETRAKVLQRARELNYQPNWVARSLITGRTQLIGLVVPDLMHSFFAEVAKGAGRRLELESYNSVIFNSEQQPEAEERQIHLLIARKVDGIIIATSQPQENSAPFATLAERNMPYVLIDRRIDQLDASFVGVDDEEIGMLATNHLIEQGCSRIAHIKGPEVATGEGRLGGYFKAITGAGLPAIPEYVVNGGYSYDDGYLAMQELLRRPERPDGVFSYNDPMAAGAMKAIFEAGLSVPEDVAVVGAGNIQYSDIFRVPLTTIDQSSAVIGEKAAELLLHRIGAKSPAPAERIMIQPKLVVRASSLRAARRSG